MTDLSRREALSPLAAVPVVLVQPVTARRVHAALREALAAGQAYAPKFFTAHEYQTTRVLVDLVLPADERSGSATDALVPEFMDYIASEYEHHRLPLRGGLAWLDAECERRFGTVFLDSTATQRTAVLDDIAWPKKARPEMSQGVSFFNHFRDLTASGFFSSQMGVKDLRYLGNTFVAEWKGCPPEALAKLGVSYPAD